MVASFILRNAETQEATHKPIDFLLVWINTQPGVSGLIEHGQELLLWELVQEMSWFAQVFKILGRELDIPVKAVELLTVLNNGRATLGGQGERRAEFAPQGWPALALKDVR
jgi:hypothetical protein